MMKRLLIGFVFVFSPLAARAEDPRDASFFESKIRPILVDSCFRCHGGQKVSGKLRVDSREALLKGGENGPAIVAGRTDESRLVEAIKRVDGVAAMPPDKPLRPDQVEALSAWIKAGAPWPKSTPTFQVEKHWAFEPIKDVAPPEPKDTAWRANPIDRFVASAREAAGRPTPPELDRARLIRRATFVLTGLPPTPAETKAFLEDKSTDAWAKVVDRLLNSPRFGEQFGRHWLDVARYADTAGENSDHPLPHAWRYRNWVISAFNRDLPFDRFIKDQIAGDLYASDDDAYADHVVGTAYLALARRFGHDIDKDVHLTYEDAIDNMGKTFLGLTLGCARCHDHKYDPITSRDYYGLYGVLDGTKLSFPGCEPKQQPRDLIPLKSPKAFEASVKPWRDRLKQLDLAKAKETARTAVLARHAGEIAAKAAVPLSVGEIEDGKGKGFDAGKKTDLGSVKIRAGETILLRVMPRGNHGADSTKVELTIKEKGGPRRWSTDDLIDTLLAEAPAAPWFFADAREGLAPMPERLEAIDGRGELKGRRNGDTPSVFVNTAKEPVKVWTTLPPRSFFVHPGPKGPVAVSWTAPADMTIELAGSIADAHPGGDGVGWTLEHIGKPELAAKFKAIEASAVDASREVAERKELLARLAIPVAFGAAEGTPHDARMHKRGDPENLGDPIPRRFPAVLGGRPLGDAKRSGRKELAEAIVAPDNPLTARVIVNRVWLWHFGRGIVDTPNDFGTRGNAPSDPALLDYLARAFMKNGWSIKRLSREILMSRAFRVAMPERRLTAEELRDSLLYVSGLLDETPAEAHPFPPESTWSFSQHAPFAGDYPTDKRSIYQLQKRNRRDRFFALFDGADPNAATPARETTTVPTQALFFMNDPLFHRAATEFATRVEDAGTNNRDRLRFAYRTLFSRDPDDEETRDAEGYLKTFRDPRDGWRSYARVLLSGNEFIYFD